MTALIIWLGRATGLSSLLSAIAAYALIAALAGGALWAYGAYKHHAGYVAGETHERGDWQERLRLAAIAQAAETKIRQADIDAAAQDLVNKQRADRETIASLEQALLHEKDQDNVPPNPVKPAACRPAGISAGVSKSLDAIGRQPTAQAGRPH